MKTVAFKSHLRSANAQKNVCCGQGSASDLAGRAYGTLLDPVVGWLIKYQDGANVIWTRKWSPIPVLTGPDVR